MFENPGRGPPTSAADAHDGIYYTCSKIRLTENVFSLIPTLAPTLKHNNAFGLTKWCHFSSKCTADTPIAYMCFINKLQCIILLINKHMLPYELLAFKDFCSSRYIVIL